MVKHVVGIGALTTVIVVCTFLPFLPGSYDGFAVTLSAMAQVVGVGGLPAVPIGALWILYRRGAYYFAIAALTAASLVATIACAVAFFSVGFSIGVGLLTLCAYSVRRTVSKLKALQRAQSTGLNPVPFYLVAVPTIVAILQFSWIDAATEFSRQRAIDNSAPFLRDIEQYYTANGRYPASLLALWKDYKPSVIGIPEFHYEPNGDSYNLFFELPPSLVRHPGTREIVMYNKRDEHFMAAHNSDILLWTPEQLRARRGYYAVHDGSVPHWRYFLFD